MSIFDRYAPFIQDFIYSHDWKSLRGVQIAAAEAIFDTDDNILLSASTASGKTEAAFFPILSEFLQDPPTSIGAIYIGPLKALINDQFERLTELCKEADIPIWHWHGDVAQSHKTKMINSPSGILQITPESLEALLIRRHSSIPKLFCDLRYVVIDEVHSLLRADRGGQTLCLIERLSRMAGVNPRRIGLSATIGNPHETGEFLSAGTGRKTIVPKIEEPKRTWRISMEHFYTSAPQPSVQHPMGLDLSKEVSANTTTVSTSTSANTTNTEVRLQPIVELLKDNGTEISHYEPIENPSDSAPSASDPAMGYIFEHSKGKKCLIFANSREEAEGVCTTLRQYCEYKNEPDRFLIHHGNLSSSIREDAEDKMKDDSLAFSTVTTATLELGIDIGKLERAFQIDAPFTVSSFLQRMGRTGRRDLPPEMWFVIREDALEPRALLPLTIPWKLLQGIALVQLYLENRWVEPPNLNRLPYSLLLHQTLSTLISEGSLTPPQLAQRILGLTYFHRVDLDDFRLLLKHMLKNDLIEQDESGSIMAGLEGEKIANSFKFYAVFQENEEYTVRSESQEIGTIVAPPPVGDKIAIAGHVWVVDETDHKRRIVYCTQVKGKVPAYFGECPGEINTLVLERMLGVLQEQTNYPYIMEGATKRLNQARQSATISNITSSSLLNLGGDTWVIFPWLGTYSFMALERIIKIFIASKLKIKGIETSKPYFIMFRTQASAHELFDAFCEILQNPPRPIDLLYPHELPLFEKYDCFLPPELVRKGFAYGVLDLDGALDRIQSWVSAKCEQPGLPN